MPGLRTKAEHLLAECKEKLAELPRPIAVDASTEILTRVTDFCQNLTATVNGLDLITDDGIRATDGEDIRTAKPSDVLGVQEEDPSDGARLSRF